MNYLKPLIAEYEKHRNEDNAIPMKKYMKNNFEFLGIKSPDRKIINRAFFQEYGLPELTEIQKIINELWQKSEREYQYFAMELLEKCLRKLSTDIIELLEFMILNKSWWDSVDLIATHLVGKLFENNHEMIHAKTSEWMKSGNIWLQRTCILFQLKYKEKTDFALLKKFILALVDSKEFFIQKAIGWALREYSKISPQIVYEFIKSHQLASLSTREGLRIIEKNRLIK